MYSLLLLWLQYIIDGLYDLGKTVGKSTFSTVSPVTTIEFTPRRAQTEMFIAIQYMIVTEITKIRFYLYHSIANE